MMDLRYAYHNTATPNPNPAPPSPSRQADEDFFAWLDRMHARAPTVHVGEVYANGDDVVEVLAVTTHAVQWRAGDGAAQSSYRVTFEEWAASEGTVRR